MYYERGNTRIYACSHCRVDTPHVIKAQRGETCAVVCSNCASGSLVHKDDLQRYQRQWEEELQHLLDELAPMDRYSLSDPVHDE